MQRRFSLDEDFMNYKTNDIVYGYMRMISTSKPNPDKSAKDKRIEYLLFSTYRENKTDIALTIGKTTKTVDNNVKKLIDAGLVEMGTIKLNDKEVGCYYFPYDYDGLYKLIEVELLKYLVHTSNSNTIRIYLCLLNWYDYKEDYVFTQREVLTALGYANTTKSAVVGDILYSLNSQGIIKYETFYEEVEDAKSGKVVPSPRMRLKFVAKNRNDF